MGGKMKHVGVATDFSYWQAVDKIHYSKAHEYFKGGGDCYKVYDYQVSRVYLDDISLAEAKWWVKGEFDGQRTYSIPDTR